MSAPVTPSGSPRVLHVSQPTSEGVPRVVVDLVRQQVGQGWQVVVACPAQGTLAEEAAAAGAHVLTWAATRSPGPAVVGESARLASLVRRVRPSVVHLHSAKAGLAGRLAVRGRLPTVYQPHAWSFLAVRGRLRALTERWERIALRWTDVVVCVSRAELDQGTEVGLRLDGRAVVVPNGVDVQRFVPGDRHEARRQLGLGDGPLAVCVGRLSRQKGQDVLLEAWRRVVEAVPGARLALVGDGPDQESLAAAAHPSVSFVGLADPVPWYVASDVVVLPSRWEGMALVPLEASACGRSVVVTDVAGAREAVLSASNTAVVPPEEPVALAAALVGRLRDRAAADREGEKARRHVLQHHDVRVTTSRLFEAYRRAMASGGRGT